MSSTKAKAITLQGTTYRLGQGYVEFYTPRHRGTLRVSIFLANNDDNIRFIAQYKDGPCVSPTSLYMNELETYIAEAQRILAGGSTTCVLATD